MPHFLYRLIPPRPTFPADMTDEEGAIMQEHFGYWAATIERREAVAYGPVMDPNGTYGIAVVEVDHEASARRLAEEDPAIAAGAGFRFELHPMPDAIARP
ncbi:MAG TPA: YciI family protein [Gaiellaceae bacterium]|nr:YciI family protein [Gaiellaceae bacterium]HEX2506512.1 YciI family protein [Gaiellaceae bacterium]